MIASFQGDGGAHPARVYVAAISAGVFYPLFGTIATTLVRLFAAWTLHLINL
ncbi:benzoate/H(+) symporter BenE family transporter [Skermanella rosea]|uniref:benzoate/H(+) symporter BenE family transporter n=1 Tax=Skermanella rosea TaxID=1817965 RepID=UPI0019316E9A|nr:benzoate/H(+) symporter BenE family transporter [Skermanella rosea]UEM05997.1 benzoate/H(+) symporter BenE family transporter [Skermanella rosea]